MHSIRQAIWGDVWKSTVEKSQTSATSVNMHHLGQAIWGHIWKHTVEKVGLLARPYLPSNNHMKAGSDLFILQIRYGIFLNNYIGDLELFLYFKRDLTLQRVQKSLRVRQNVFSLLFRSLSTQKQRWQKISHFGRGWHKKRSQNLGIAKKGGGRPPAKICWWIWHIVQRLT